jgi:hypothetical protein
MSVDNDEGAVATIPLGEMREAQVVAQWSAALRAGDYETAYYWAVVADTHGEGAGRRLLCKGVLLASKHLHVAYPGYAVELVRRLLRPRADGQPGYVVGQERETLCWLTGLLVFASKGPANALVRPHNLVADDIMACDIDPAVEAVRRRSAGAAEDATDGERITLRLLSGLRREAAHGRTHEALRWLSALDDYAERTRRERVGEAPHHRQAAGHQAPFDPCNWRRAFWDTVQGAPVGGRLAEGTRPLRALAALHALVAGWCGGRDGKSRQLLPMLTHGVALYSACANARFCWASDPRTPEQRLLMERAVANHLLMYERVRADRHQHQTAVAPTSPSCASARRPPPAPRLGKLKKETETEKNKNTNKTKNKKSDEKVVHAWDRKMDLVDRLDPNVR